jgi:hypothetical protein
MSLPPHRVLTSTTRCNCHYILMPFLHSSSISHKRVDPLPAESRAHTPTRDRRYATPPPVHDRYSPQNKHNRAAGRPESAAKTPPRLPTESLNQPTSLSLSCSPLSLSCSLFRTQNRKSQLTGLTRRSGRRKSPRRVHESGQCGGRGHGVREEAKHLNTSVKPAVMQARAEEENFSTRVALGVRLGSEAVEPQRQLLDRSTCESWCKKEKPP